MFVSHLWKEKRALEPLLFFFHSLQERTNQINVPLPQSNGKNPAVARSDILPTLTLRDNRHIHLWLDQQWPKVLQNVTSPDFHLSPHCYEPIPPSLPLLLTFNKAPLRFSPFTQKLSQKRCFIKLHIYNMN